MGLGDPRSEGSGNPGASNVLRLYGKKTAILTLAGDVLKGIIPVLIAKMMQAPDLFVALTALAAFLGHLYPIFFGFRGGKGVATLIGILLGTYWLLGLAYIGTWLLVALICRYSSLSAITAAAMTPVYSWLLLPELIYTLCFSTITITLIWRHRTNIKNILAGSENKIGTGI